MSRERREGEVIDILATGKARRKESEVWSAFMYVRRAGPVSFHVEKEAARPKLAVLQFALC